MKKKHIKIIMAISLIILCVLIFSLNHLLSKKEIETETKTDVEMQKEAINEYCEDKVLPRGVSTLYSQYKGDNSKNDLYRNFNNLVQYLPDLYDDINGIDENKLLDYYNEHSSNIKKYLGIEYENDFVKLAKYIQTTNLGDVTFNSCEIDTTTYEDNDNYLSFNLELIYNNLEDPVNLKVYFANDSSTKPMVVYSTAE